jgi:Xaa-Pro aminopeptidase
MRHVFEEFNLPPYPHGTGHGIGIHVHEWGTGIGPRKKEFQHHSLTSVEPGFYKEGLGGIRLENIALIHKEHKLKFENLYEIPYDKDLIDFDLLSQEERSYLERNCQLI